ncbi:hypothetical protein [Solibacillus sp. FSL K6-4121]|uniref:hypothetical protein n=1 Tax=Solibacillus sp. FSL K6-4121 TaxID=2921505 RepID=UPI0030FC667B
MNIVDILIISNKLDFGTDYICLELEKKQANYLRINRDEFSDYDIIFDLKKLQLLITVNDIDYIISDNNLKSIYYRAPIYLRDIYKPNIPIEEQLYRTQWTAFIRNLTIFENAKWMNNPISTFKSENKLLQLKYANRLGFLTPNTYITNTSNIDINDNQLFIAKSLDTAVLRIDDKEAFIYSNLVTAEEIKNSSLELSPVVIQDYIGNNSYKIDIRVTIIEEELFAVRILKNGQGINGDWRREKDNIEYIKFDLPNNIKQKCVTLTKSLSLNFGAIDLIEYDNDFYFLEINPTGEWAWLVENAELPIAERICDALCSPK